VANFHRDRLDPIEQMRKRGWPCEHVTYDPKLRKGNCDYQIVRGSTHDGTLLFTLENIERTLINLANRVTFHKPKQAEFEAAWPNVRYVVGPLLMATVTGMVKLPCSEDQKYPGQRERLRIAVKVLTASDAGADK
jgi:hypothetical protein